MHEENSIYNTFINGVLRKNGQKHKSHQQNNADKYEVLHLSIVNNHKNKIHSEQKLYDLMV